MTDDNMRLLEIVQKSNDGDFLKGSQPTLSETIVLVPGTLSPENNERQRHDVFDGSPIRAKRSFRRGNSQHLCLGGGADRCQCRWCG